MVKLTALSLAMIPVAFGQLGLGGKKMQLERMLPPAIEVEGKSFSITATAQDATAREVAASFSELFRGKIQGAAGLTVKDSNPDLRVSIAITRYYSEAKQLTKPGRTPVPCTTFLGNLQGTFTILDAKTRVPLASDVIGWKLQAGRTRHWLVGEDGSQMNIAGPREKLGLDSVFQFSGEENGGSRLPGPFARSGHPCDMPFTQNEVRDALADAFLTDIIRLALPYKVLLEVPLPGGKLKTMSEDLAGGRSENGKEEAEKLGRLPKVEDETDRLYLIALANEIAGYKLGGQIFEARQKIKRDISPEELAKVQAEIKRLVDQAKERFDQAALHYKQAADAKEEKHYRDGERRAEQSQRLYARIKRYGDLKPPSDEPPPPSGLSMNDIVNLCNQGLEAIIIVDRIERAPLISATRDDIAELSKCGPKQTEIFKALKGRWDAKTSEPQRPKTQANN